MRRLLLQGAHFILGPFGEDCDLRRWGKARLEGASKNAKKRVYVAVARKLAVLMHYLWVTVAVYDPLHLAKQRGEAPRSEEELAEQQEGERLLASAAPTGTTEGCKPGKQKAQPNARRALSPA